MVGAAGGLDLRPGFCLASFQQGLQAFYKDTGRKARWRQLKAGRKQAHSGRTWRQEGG